MTPTMIEVKPINTNSANEFSNQANQLTLQVNSLTIKNQESYENAADLLKNVKGLIKKLDETRKSITAPLDIAKKAVMDLFRSPSDVLETAEAKIKRAMIDYTNEQERIRRETELRLQREADEKARKEQERLNARAMKAEESGRVEKAEELRQKATEVQYIAPVIAPTIQKAEGVSIKKLWKARVVDANLIPREYLSIDEQKLNAVARATKGSLTIPGVQFYAEDSLASR